MGISKTYTSEELELLADKFLFEHDEYFASNKRNKRQNTEFNYETKCQERFRRKREFLFSQLGKKQLLSLCDKNVDVQNYIND